MSANLLLDLLPAGLGLFVVVLSAGLMGFFKTYSMSKQAYLDTIAALSKQIETLEHHIVKLEERIEKLSTQNEQLIETLEEYKSKENRY